MKKQDNDSRERLFEMMHKVGKMPLNEETNYHNGYDMSKTYYVVNVNDKYYIINDWDNFDLVKKYRESNNIIDQGEDYKELAYSYGLD